MQIIYNKKLKTYWEEVGVDATAEQANDVEGWGSMSPLAETSEAALKRRRSLDNFC